MATLLCTSPEQNARSYASRLFSGAVPARVRTIAEFVQDELIFPTGPFIDEHFRREIQPFVGLYLDALSEAHATGRWNRAFTTGPGQSGKSLFGFAVPAMYHLFELKEDVILGVPTAEMAAHKWKKDIEPVIAASRYRDLLPSEGRGSRGGKATEIHFRNGKSLLFMTGGAGDKSRAGATARVIIATEVDGFDVTAETSREGDKFSQLEARTNAFRGRKMVYGECTVSIAQGRIWHEYMAGTASRIVRPCPYCGEWVTPEREHLRGWQEAETERQARSQAHFVCPACAHPWTEAERRAANVASKLIHRGQTIACDGTISGELPETETLGFRWSGVDNQFATAGDIGVEEWKSLRSANPDNTDKVLCQFTWAIPPQATSEDDTPLDWQVLRKRTAPHTRGVVLPDTVRLSIGIDVMKWYCYYVVTAWLRDGRGHVVDHDTFRLATDQLGVEQAIRAGLKGFADDRVAKGWADKAGRVYWPDKVVVDSGYQPDDVHAACLAIDPELDWRQRRWWPILGSGFGQPGGGHYSPPSQLTASVRFLGEQFHVEKIQGRRLFILKANVDYWKSWWHGRMAIAVERPGSVTLFEAAKGDFTCHDEYCRQVTAEKKVIEVVPGKGPVEKWTNESNKKNHGLDGSVYASIGGVFAGFKLAGMAEGDDAPATAAANQAVNLNQWYGGSR